MAVSKNRKSKREHKEALKRRRNKMEQMKLWLRADYKRKLAEHHKKLEEEMLADEAVQEALSKPLPKENIKEESISEEE